MVQIAKQQEQSLLGRITALHELFRNNHDQENAERAIQLAKKLSEKEFSIAFCGHFSAGKSTMINELVGEKLLPSSPIPTSANLVKVKAGEEYAKVIFKRAKPRLYLAPYDYEKVKTYCKDGDEIESVEISYQHANLPKNVVIMDTPGIDSTDDAHRIATESALHLADLVLYVMDYNHVQSEVNFLFAKELTEAGKELCLVINQIDKHREEELSFGQFQESVKNAFASWGVRPDHIFYTTLKDPGHPYNRFSELKSFLQKKMDRRDELLPNTIYQSLTKLSKDHINNIQERNDDEIEALERILSELSHSERLTLKTDLELIQFNLNAIKQEVKIAEKEFDDEISNILNNAYIMPFQTRELAEQYLQACQPEFKVGLFFTKTKTDQERKERLQRFFEDLSEKIKSQLDWHLREYLLKALKENGIHLHELMEKVQSFSVVLTPELLEQTVKQGARLSGDYVLNYTNDVTNAIKAAARREITAFKELFVPELSKLNEDKARKLEKDFNYLNKFHSAIEKLNFIIEKHEIAERKAEKALHGELDLLPYIQKATELLEPTEEEVEVVRDSLNNFSSTDKKENGSVIPNEVPLPDKVPYSKKQMEHLISQLRFTAEKISVVPGLKKISGELKKRAERLERKEFTVALFGAFSAGKSSFANALIGDNLLPVSPNPTTAAINRIKPIDEDHPHGTVIVKLKKSEALLEEVRRSLKAFDAQAASFPEAIELIGKMLGEEENFDSSKKTHYAFLRAFYHGFSKYEEQLGDTLLSDLNEFREFVALEEKSCLVEWIDVYFDCLLTKEGITLVDTPGADSINARHTNVAFEYIKNSDAILFVTYYNHAFSKADREFLIQLGRVKESFELDKMFFIINAIDLASTEDEMLSVVDYVKDQLVTYGIRNPNMFTVSSLLALKEKLSESNSNDSRIKLFENAFYQFITGELMSMVVSAANRELTRAIQLVHQLLSSAQEDQTGKEQKRLQTIAEQQKIQQFIKGQNEDFLKKRLSQEADELLFYIKQRVFFRFNDFFKESFSPAVLKADGRDMKHALKMALQEFLESFGFDFVQEMRATTLRLEAFIRKIVIERCISLGNELQERQNGLSFSSYDPEKMDGITIGYPYQAVDEKSFSKALSYYKNPKSFFEKNEKKFMAEELERVLQQPTDVFLKEEGERVKIHYLRALEDQNMKMINHISEQVDEYYNGILSALSNEFPIDELMKVERQITSF